MMKSQDPKGTANHHNRLHFRSRAQAPLGPNIPPSMDDQG